MKARDSFSSQIAGASLGIHAGRLPGLDLPEAAEMLAEEVPVSTGASTVRPSFH